MSCLKRRLALSLVSAAAMALTACYVVPIQPAPGARSGTEPRPASMPALTFSARLYPANDAAASYGMQQAVVTNELDGHGHFSAMIRGEQFTGEATREARSSREGIGNAAGNQGGMLSCRYTLNSATQGTGQCTLNGNARFTMHFGN